MAVSDNIIAFDSARSSDRMVSFREEYRNTVNACRQALLKMLPQRMDDLFERLDDILYSLADKADSNQSQLLYFDSMRELRKEREGIENRFNQSLLEGYDQFWKSGPPTRFSDPAGSPQPGDEFSLVDNYDLEEGLAVDSMVSKGENAYFRDLYALDQRFSYLLNGLQVAGEGNPVSPALFCQIFKASIDGISIELPIKLIIYKQFEREVIGRIGQFYDELNVTLAKAGVLPRLKHSVRRNPEYAHQPVGSEDSGELDNSHQAEAVGSLQQSELFSTLQQLLGQRRGGFSSGNLLPAAPNYEFETLDVLSALSTLQHDGVMGGANLPQNQGVDGIRDNLFQVLGIQPGNQQEVGIKRGDEDALDIIALLFEFILDDPGLSDAMRALLGRLQIPMLKVAILDKSFFSRKEHPARKLLNNLAQAAIGWSEQAGRGQDDLYGRIESVIGRVLSEFDDNVGLFAELNDQFSAFLEQEQQGVKVAEKRAAQVTQGKEQLDQAKARVEQEIRRCLGDRQSLPAVVLTILEFAWKDVLLLIRLRKGVESKEWRQAVRLMERLIWSVDPKEGNQERQELLQTIPGLLKGLRVGLNGISFDQHKMTEIFKELQLCHVSTLRDEERARPVEIVPVSPPGNDEEIDDELGEILEEIVLETPKPFVSPTGGEGDRFYRMAESLSIGTWLELKEEDAVLRIKLSWRSDTSGKLLFVNRKGMKVYEKSLGGLAIWFREGKISVLEETDMPLMDRALSAMMKALHKDSLASP